MMNQKQFATTFAEELALVKKFGEAYDVTIEVRYVLDMFDEGGFYCEVAVSRDGDEYETFTHDVAESKAHTFNATKHIATLFAKHTETTWTKKVYA